jgi:hypothetical protein
MCPSLAPERMDLFYSYLVFKSSFITGWCPNNVSILAPEIRALHKSPKNKMAIFSKTAPTILIKFQ